MRSLLSLSTTFLLLRQPSHGIVGGTVTPSGRFGNASTTNGKGVDLSMSYLSQERIECGRHDRITDAHFHPKVDPTRRLRFITPTPGGQ